jgi:hypothetical protein
MLFYLGGMEFAARKCPAAPVLLGFVLQCSVQVLHRPRTIALHPDVGEGAKPAGSSLQAGFFYAFSPELATFVAAA